MAHWISSKLGLKELQEQGAKLCERAETDMQRLLQQLAQFHEWVVSLSQEGQGE